AMRRELALVEAARGPAAPQLSTPLHNLAATLERQGGDAHLAEVAALLRRAVAVHERASGARHPDTARALLRLGQFEADQGRHADADALFARAASGLDAPPGALPAGRAEVLAEVVAAQGRLQLEQLAYARAEPLLARAVALSTEALGADDPLTGRRLGEWAAALSGLGQPERAEPLLRRALAIAEQHAGARSAEAGDALNRLAALASSQRRHAEAEVLYQRALAIRAASWAAAPAAAYPAYRQGLDTLAFHFQAQGAPERAEPLFRRAVEVTESRQPPDPAALAQAALNLAENLRAQRRPAEAETWLRRALALETGRLGSDHPRPAQLQGRLAALRWTQGDAAAAETLYRQALATLAASPLADRGDSARLLDDLAALYRATQRPAEALASRRRAEALRLQRP
ncbi:MAG: tetratricopeptide repeat protein, partial [Burkholderiaceae bacterium]|nr:tetratricopeptide repeat protein [Burkholderiaceae bacterium]